MTVEYLKELLRTAYQVRGLSPKQAELIGYVRNESEDDFRTLWRIEEKLTSACGRVQICRSYSSESCKDTDPADIKLYGPGSLRLYIGEAVQLHGSSLEYELLTPTEQKDLVDKLIKVFKAVPEALANVRSDIEKSQIAKESAARADATNDLVRRKVRARSLVESL